MDVMIGPYLVLPDATLREEGRPYSACPHCPGMPRREGTFCSVCGTALVAHTPVEEHDLHLLRMDVEEDRWFQPEHCSKPVVLFNHQSDHIKHLDTYNSGDAVDTTTLDAQAALDWYRAECAPIVDWLRAQGLPDPTFHYGVVAYVI